MTDGQPPKSPALLPPRKRTELEDPGAHDLDSSADEGDVFTDAHDGRKSPNSPMQSPHMKGLGRDDLAVIAEGSHNEISTRAAGQDPLVGKHSMPIPMTVVEKVDPEVAGYGDIPGTASYTKRRADAVPDAVFRAPSPGERSPLNSPTKQSFPSPVTIPKTVVTKVDSEPRHGEVPGTDAYKVRTEDAAPDVVEEEGDVPSLPTSSHRSRNPNHIISRCLTEVASPIAEDGGFGPMIYEDEDDEGDEDKDNFNKKYKADSRGTGGEEIEYEKEEDAFASDFDDFEEVAAADDFGDFDNGNPEAVVADKPVQAVLPNEAFQTTPCSFSVLDFTHLKSLDEINKASSSHFSALFPLASRSRGLPPPTPPDMNSVFLSDRTLSLWSQLVAPPPLQPPNWTRSRIRRLFLVSLGVPVDLDEILPASKQKKLILPYTPPESVNSKETRKGSVARIKQSGANESTISLDSSAGPSGNTTKSSSRRRKGPPPPPEFDVSVVRQLCTTTNAALENMRDEELKAHLARLEEMTQRGKQLLQYWLRRKEAAVGDKEAFEGVIENLVRHARRVRK